MALYPLCSVCFQAWLAKNRFIVKWFCKHTNSKQTKALVFALDSFYVWPHPWRPRGRLSGWDEDREGLAKVCKTSGLYATGSPRMVWPRWKHYPTDERVSYAIHSGTYPVDKDFRSLNNWGKGLDITQPFSPHKWRFSTVWHKLISKLLLHFLGTSFGFKSVKAWRLNTSCYYFSNWLYIFAGLCTVHTVIDLSKLGKFSPHAEPIANVQENLKRSILVVACNCTNIKFT